MIHIEDIKSAHAKVKSGADFPAYIKAIKQMGVKSYATYVADGHTDYHGNAGERLTSEARYEVKSISAAADQEQFIASLRHHQQGHSSFPEFVTACATSGIEKWEVDLHAMTCTYFDRKGETILVEEIPAV